MFFYLIVATVSDDVDVTSTPPDQQDNFLFLHYFFTFSIVFVLLFSCLAVTQLVYSQLFVQCFFFLSLNGRKGREGEGGEGRGRGRGRGRDHHPSEVTVRRLRQLSQGDAGTIVKS